MLKTALILFALSFPTGVIAQKHFEFQSVCGDPTVESDAWASLDGRVVETRDGHTLIIEHNGHRQTISLAALDTSKSEEPAKAFLIRKTLHRKIKVWVSHRRYRESQVSGLVWLGRKDLNRIMVKKGLARVAEPPPYTISNYAVCVYGQLEEAAQKKEIGTWAR